MAMTLIVLAATMGNKYGGLKQLEGIGPSFLLLQSLTVKCSFYTQDNSRNALT